ncbi:hypothetical protein [Bacillus subtilis]|uniref:hypothetical protein n=1 Tax=Bacillus subtilis TaxID=1423 RepID=UPI00162A2A68|nr:hypothetical protein [Bacillus subtilis]
MKIETLSEAKKKMQELLSDPQLYSPHHYPERSIEGIVLLDQSTIQYGEFDHENIV